MKKILFLSATALLLTACNVDKAPNKSQLEQGAGGSGGTLPHPPSDSPSNPPSDPPSTPPSDPRLDEDFTATGFVYSHNTLINEWFPWQNSSTFLGYVKNKSGNIDLPVNPLINLSNTEITAPSPNKPPEDRILRRDGSINLKITAAQAKAKSLPLEKILATYVCGDTTPTHNNLSFTPGTKGTLLSAATVTINYAGSYINDTLSMTSQDKTNLKDKTMPHLENKKLFLYVNQTTPIGGTLSCAEKTLLIDDRLELKAGWNELNYHESHTSPNTATINTINPTNKYNGEWLHISNNHKLDNDKSQ